MNVSGPRDLPELRAWLVQQWQPGGSFATVAETMRGRMPLVNEHYSWLEPNFDGRELPEASLYWVSAELSQLIDHAARSLPPTTLTPELLPTPKGFVAFASPLEGLDVQPGHPPVQVRCLLWGDAHLTWLAGREHISVATYGFQESLWFPLGRSDWAFGDDTEAPVDNVLKGDERRLASMAEDRRWLATLCLLIGQDRVATKTEVRPSRQIARRLARGGFADSTVRLVDVRRRHEPSEGKGEHTVEWSHRWVVEGHWRQQAYGPNHSLRRPKFILPYIKGPTDKPIVVRPTVSVVE